MRYVLSLILSLASVWAGVAAAQEWPIKPVRLISPYPPGGGSRMLRDPLGVHGVWVNGVRVHDGKEYAALAGGPGRVLDRYDA